MRALVALLLTLAGCVTEIDAPGVGYTCTTNTGGVVVELEVCSTPWDIEAEQDLIWDACYRGCDVACVPTWSLC